MPLTQREKDRRWAQKNPESYLCVNARYRAKRRGIPFTITPKDIVIPERCPVLGMRLTFGRGCTEPGKQAKPSAASLDRINPKKGYVPGNVQVISTQANSAKNDLTRAQLLKLAKWINATFK